MTKVEIGELAENIAFEFEKNRLGKKYLDFLRVCSCNPAYGYDIESITVEGEGAWPRCIEVKAHCKSSSSVFLTENEHKTLKRLGKFAWIYIVDVANQQVIRTINNPLGSPHHLEVATYKLTI